MAKSTKKSKVETNAAGEVRAYTYCQGWYWTPWLATKQDLRRYAGGVIRRALAGTPRPGGSMDKG